jgi:signal transduction histidine kinase
MVDAPPIRVLIVDDDEDDYLLTSGLLREIPGNRFVITWESSWDAGFAAVMTDRYDICLVDYRLGARTGLELIREARAKQQGVPIILMTGQGEREIDFAAMKAGAADYLEKGTLNATLLERSIRYALRQKRSEESLEQRVRDRTAELAAANARLQREALERGRAEQALREVDRRKDDFLATLAHELRNPLAPICNALEILRLRPNDPDAIERGREMMSRQVRYLIRLIDDLLDISRITRGKIQLRREKVDVESIVQAALEGSQPLIDSGRHRVSVSLPKTRVTFMADSARLTQSLINLINNSAKYMDPGGTIWVSVEANGDHVDFRVKDRGFGIAPDMLPTIFEMFGHPDRRERASGGLGVGLALVKALVEMHGGAASAASEGPGTGSEFTIRIPLDGEAKLAG